MLRHYDAFVNYMITYGVFHFQLLLQLLQRMLCDGQLLSPLFPALPCRGPVSLWLSTELREMEVISFSSCVPLKHELLGNWTSSQISAQISLELPCDKMQKGLSHFRLHGWSSCNSCIYCNICLNLTPNIAWSYSVSLQQFLRGRKWTFSLQGECEASFRKALKCSKLLTPTPGWAPDCNS